MAERLPDWQTDVARLRDFAHVRLIVADLDGSLIHASAHVVYSSLTNLQRSLNHSHNRVAFTLATGRAWSGAKDLVDSLSIPRGTPLILYNGALTLECGTAAVIDKHCLSTQVIESVRTICSAHGATAYYYDFVDPIAALFQGKPAERVFGDGPVVLAIDFNGLEVQPYPTNVAVLMNCTAILVDVEQLGNAVSDIWKALSGVSGLMCTRSGTRYIEIRPPGVNKGAALHVVAGHLDLDIQHILTLGDNDNDAEMLSAAGIGVAVMGGSVAALDASDYVCKHGPADGAVEVMRLIKHAKRFYAPPKSHIRKQA